MIVMLPQIVAAQDLMQKCNRVIEILTGAAAECPRDRWAPTPRPPPAHPRPRVYMRARR